MDHIADVLARADVKELVSLLAQAIGYFYAAWTTVKTAWRLTLGTRAALARRRERKVQARAAEMAAAVDAALERRLHVEAAPMQTHPADHYLPGSTRRCQTRNAPACPEDGDRNDECI